MTGARGRRTATTAAGALGIAVLAACSGGGGASSSAPSTTVSASAGTSTGTSAGTSGTPSDASTPGGATSTAPTDTASNGAAQAGVTVQDATQVVATVSKHYTSPYSTGTVKVGLLPLQRRGRLMVLTVVLTPTIDPGGSRQTASFFDVFNQNIISPTLVDPVHLKQYRVVSGSRLLQSDPTSVSASSGQPMFVYAVFAAPVDPVDRLDVQLADSLPTFTDVPVR